MMNKKRTLKPLLFPMLLSGLTTLHLVAPTTLALAIENYPHKETYSKPTLSHKPDVVTDGVKVASSSVIPYDESMRRNGVARGAQDLWCAAVLMNEGKPLLQDERFKNDLKNVGIDFDDKRTINGEKVQNEYGEQFPVINLADDKNKNIMKNSGIDLNNLPCARMTDRAQIQAEITQRLQTRDLLPTFGGLSIENIIKTNWIGTGRSSFIWKLANETRKLLAIVMEDNNKSSLQKTTEDNKTPLPRPQGMKEDDRRTSENTGSNNDEASSQQHGEKTEAARYEDGKATGSTRNANTEAPAHHSGRERIDEHVKATGTTNNNNEALAHRLREETVSGHVKASENTNDDSEAHTHLLRKVMAGEHIQTSGNKNRDDRSLTHHLQIEEPYGHVKTTTDAPKGV